MREPRRSGLMRSARCARGRSSTARPAARACSSACVEQGARRGVAARERALRAGEIGRERLRPSRRAAAALAASGSGGSTNAATAQRDDRAHAGLPDALDRVAVGVLGHDQHEQRRDRDLRVELGPGAQEEPDREPGDEQQHDRRGRHARDRDDADARARRPPSRRACARARARAPRTCRRGSRPSGRSRRRPGRSAPSRRAIHHASTAAMAIRTARGSSLRAAARRACMAQNPKPVGERAPMRVLVLARRMQGTRRTRVRETARNDLVRFLDSYASLLVLLLANFLLLEIVDDARWGAVGSTLLAAVALIVAISDPETGHRVTPRHWLLIGACVALAPLVLLDQLGVARRPDLPAARRPARHGDAARSRCSASCASAGHLRDHPRRALHLRAARPALRLRLPGGERPLRPVLLAGRAAHRSRSTSTSASSR